MKNLGLPYFYNVIETKHYINGRIRYIIPILKNNQALKNLLEINFKAFKSIKMYKIYMTTGSLIVYFDESQMNSTVLSIIIIKILELEKEIEKQKIGRISKESLNFLKIMNNSIYFRSKGILDLKSTISLVLIGIGIKQFFKYPVIPNGINLVWWGFNYLNGGKNDK